MRTSSGINKEHVPIAAIQDAFADHVTAAFPPRACVWMVSAEGAVLSDTKGCFQKYRECLKLCNTENSADYCETMCQERYPCEIGECPMIFRGSCLFLPNINQDCHSDSDCSFGKRCCRFGDLGCIKICIDTRIDATYRSRSNPYRRMDWNLARKTNLPAESGS